MNRLPNGDLKFSDISCAPSTLKGYSRDSRDSTLFHSKIGECRHRSFVGVSHMCCGNATVRFDCRDVKRIVGANTCLLCKKRVRS